ncbi:MAG: hypothetical protein K2N73_10890 [Lachnospiraceae bacterium]|nr:hypothetical protein [Lachnospiraceae bacterium]
MDNNNLLNQGNQNGDQGQPYQQQPYQNYQQPYQQPYQQQYQQQQPYQSADTELEEPVSFADWMVTTLILCIPCLNIIMMFVWAFGSGTKKSKSNYFKAMLVWALISIVLMIVFVATYGAVFLSMVGSTGYY